MLDSSFVDRVTELAVKPQLVNPTEGQLVMDPQGKLLHVPVKPTPAVPTLSFNTLAALVSYLAENRDGLEPDALVLHVVSPTEVRLLGPLEGEDNTRHVYARATATDLLADFLGKPMGQVEFQASLLTRFEDAGSRAEVLALTARLVEEQTLEAHADGMGQTVTVKKGVHLNRQEPVPTLVTLTGYRSFREVDQPAQAFVLRIAAGQGLPPTLALHEGDGGAWRLEQVVEVARWLRIAQQDAQGELPEADRAAPVPVLA